MAFEQGAQFSQPGLVPGHEPDPVVGTAGAWAAKVAGAGAEVRFERAETEDGRQKDHVLSVHVPGRTDPVGHLAWDDRHGVVDGVYVTPRYRRKGLATGLWNIAKAFGNEHPQIAAVKHSPVQLPAGKVWARSVGD